MSVPKTYHGIAVTTPQHTNNRKAYCLEDGSPSSVKAVISDNSLNDPDSSIEFLGQHKSSPHSRALRHIALAQANLLEVDRHTSGRKLKTTMSIYSTVSSNIASMAQPVPEPYRRRRIPFAKSPSPSERSYSTDSVSRNTSTANRPTSAELDWDDPVLNPSVRSRTPPSMPGSESSDLPELPFKGRSEGTSAVKPTTTTYRGSETVSQQDWEQLHAPTTATSNRREVDPAKLKKLRAVGRQHMREEKEARMLQKQAKQEELKDKYRTFSYDSTTAITPKVWYYRGLASGQIKFMGCDTRSGFSTEHERLLEEVLADLKGYSRFSTSE